jgi:hypothetical protein
VVLDGQLGPLQRPLIRIGPRSQTGATLSPGRRAVARAGVAAPARTMHHTSDCQCADHLSVRA